MSDDPETAWLQAVAEAIERYCMLFPHGDERVVRATFNQVADDAVPVERFALFTSEQWASMPMLRLPTHDEAIDWTWGYSLTRGCPVQVPAALAHASVRPRPPNNLIRGLSSTGIAAHVSIEAALLAGLLEVVERDSLMISWFSRRIPRRILVDDKASYLHDLIEKSFRTSDFEFVLLDMTCDTGIPTVACLGLSDNPDRPAAVMGAAARVDFASAARKALIEAAQVIAALYVTGWKPATPMAESEVRTFEDHARYYAAPEGAERLMFLTQSGEDVELSTLQGIESFNTSADLARGVARLDEIGLEVIAVDLTTADVAKCGYRVVKVLVPGAVDINADGRFPHLGSARVCQVPSKLSWNSSMVDGEGINVSPCPLP